VSRLDMRAATSLARPAGDAQIQAIRAGPEASGAGYWREWRAWS
jgi:hypothetical protein